jgi:hypothetical protein
MRVLVVVTCLVDRRESMEVTVKLKKSRRIQRECSETRTKEMRRGAREGLVK